MESVDLRWINAVETASTPKFAGSRPGPGVTTHLSAAFKKYR